jgi:phosphorylase/glycogen(starch) synthase
MTASSFQLAKELADWKRKMPMRFSSLKLLDVIVGGIHGDTITIGQQLIVKARVDPGKLEPGEIQVELMIGKEDRHGFVGTPECVPLELVEKSDGILTFSVQYTLKQNGTHAYGIRVLPYHKDLSNKNEPGLILWG